MWGRFPTCQACLFVILGWGIMVKMGQRADWKEDGGISTDSCGQEFSFGSRADSGTAKDGSTAYDGMEV